MTSLSSPAYLDTGLLSPVRVGTPVEAEVSDRAWLQAMLDAEAALARAQATLGVVPFKAADTISRAAEVDRLDARAIAVAARETANPVVGLVQAFTRIVADEDPDAAEYVHRGSTSQDIFDTGAMLVALRALRILRADLDRIAAALAVLAAEHRATPMVARTLALHAVPTTFGLKAAGWRHLVIDAVERVDRLISEGLPVSLGGAAGTLAGYLEYAAVDSSEAVSRAGGPNGYADQLVATYAAETGLACPVLPWHALRTPMADLASVLAFVSGALGKIAADVLVLNRTETAEVSEPSVAGRGSSSAMPQKHNPVLSTMIRSAALQVPLLATGLTQCLVTEDERAAGVWHAEWALLRECLRLTGGAAHTAVELAEGLVPRRRQMRANLDLTGAQVVSERIAAVLAPRIGKAAAKHLLTRACAESEAGGGSVASFLAAAPELTGRADLAELTALCDPTGYLGAASHLVDRALAELRERTAQPGKRPDR
ncbi:class-II fumarase/aspartase family protein [Streptomyces hokutonensis]|uniref:class-II fumarase/aspartase family protein n=1 Tax=Streptomyces hokutonensis TaxID=1306990 RepID=UPI0033E78B73